MKKTMASALAGLAGVLLMAASCGKALSPEAALVLDPAASKLSAVAVKNETVNVELRFPGLEGSAKASGEAELRIALGSLETGDVARDHNIKELFFEASKPLFGTAVFRLKSLEQLVAGMKAGSQVATRGEGSLGLHGSESSLGGPLLIKHEGKRVSVDLGEGWTVMIDKAGMGKLLKALNKACPQPHRVGNAVTVKGKLVFKLP
jgi:polyisoprenoid-binding protein YceI